MESRELYPLRPLEELVDIYDSMRVPVKKADRKSGPYPYYGASGIADYVDSYIFDGKYLLLAEDGENLKTRNTPIAFLASGKFWVNNHAHILRAKSSSDTRFLCYALQIADVNSYLSGSTRPKLTQGDMKRIPVFAPEKSIKKAIAHVLGSLDERIELNRRMNETLESMAQALFKSWFVDFDPVIDNALAGGKEIPAELSEKAQARAALGDKRRPLPEEIRALFPDEFTYSDELGWIPKGWEVSSVGKEFDVTMGQSPPGTTYNSNGEGIAFFQGRADFGFRYPSNRVYCTAPKRFANKGDTLISVRAPVGDVNMAHIDCCIGRGVSAARHKSGSRSFTYYSMLELRENFNKFEAEGTVFGSINQKDFKALLQLKKDKKLLEAFEAQAGALDGKIEQNSLAILNLTKLRDTLLPKLLSGEVRIPETEKMVEELAL